MCPCSSSKDELLVQEGIKTQSMAATTNMYGLEHKMNIMQKEFILQRETQNAIVNVAPM